MDNQLEKQLRDTRNGGGEGEARNIKVALLKMIKQCKKEYIKKRGREGGGLGEDLHKHFQVGKVYER